MFCTVPVLELLPPEAIASKTNINVGAIVGGVIGVIVLLAAVALFYILFYQRHGGVYEYSSHKVSRPPTLFTETAESPQSGRPPTIVPFNVSPLQDNTSNGLPGGAEPSLNYSGPLLRLTKPPQLAILINVITLRHLHYPHYPHPPPFPTPGAKADARCVKVHVRYRHPPSHLALHEDCGVQLQGGPAPDSETLTSVPPVYRHY